MSKTQKYKCPQCRVFATELAALREELARFREELAQVREELARAKKDSSTSSKPPSSDIVKPKPPEEDGDGSKRKIGGQPGHPKHEREPFPPEQVTHFEVHKLDACPDCGGKVRKTIHLQHDVQQVDIQAESLTVEQHTCPQYRCERCQKLCAKPLPLRIQRGGLVGPNLTARIAFLKGVCHASFSTIRKYLRDVLGAQIGRSMLHKVINKVSQALEGPYEELLIALPFEDLLNIDETGHKNNGERWWTWCFRAELYTLFKVDESRGTQVLLEMLGTEFDGVIGCDYFSAYRSYMNLTDVLLQFCLAHLIRDVKFLTKLPDAQDRAYGERLLREIRDMFGVIHRRDQMSKAEFTRELERARDLVLYWGQHNAPATRHAQNMANRFRKHGEAYFRFVTTPGVEPTNNSAEQAIRFVVIDRLITQGTRSESGRRWCERIWTTIATCAQQGRSGYNYLKEAIINWFHGRPSPSLLPNASPA